MGFLDRSGVAKLLRQIFRTFSKNDHKHDYTPEGDIEVEITENISGNYTPSGTVSAPIFNGDEAEINVSGNVDINISSKLEFTGTTESLVGEFIGEETDIEILHTPEGTVSAPEITMENETTDFVTDITVSAPDVINNISLSDIYNESTGLVELVFNNELLVSAPEINIERTKGVTKTRAVSSAPIFTGSISSTTASVTPKGKISINDITPKGTINQPVITGTANLSGSITPSGTISTPEFTGTTVEVKNTFNGKSSSTNIPQGNIS